jgi:Zn-dependent peptidase ImmA (M78 family)
MEEKKLDLFGTSYSISKVQSIEDENGSPLYGITNYIEHTIEIATKINGRKVSKEEQKITLLHELFHAFLKEGQYLSCSSDEPLVEWLARCTNKAIEQKIL